jgi:hypothetical protein
MVIGSSLTLMFLSFFFLSFHSISSLDSMLAMQKIVSTLQFLFSFDSVILLLIIIVLFTLIISN